MMLMLLSIKSSTIVLIFASDDNLLDVIAHELIAKKMLMEDKLRNALWSSSMTASLTGEDRLISQLLLEDEQNAMDMDKSLAANDIGV